MDLTQGATSNATLEIGDNGMGITLSGAFPLWEDDEKFEDLISLLRKEARDGAQGAQGGVGIKKNSPAWRLFFEQIGVGSGTRKSEDEDIFVLSVNQEPIWGDMALSMTQPLPSQGMIATARGQWPA